MNRPVESETNAGAAVILGYWIEHMMFDNPPNPRTLGVWRHVCVGARDIQKVYQTVMERGYKPRRPPNIAGDGRWLLHIYDQHNTRTEVMIRSRMTEIGSLNWRPHRSGARQVWLRRCLYLPQIADSGKVRQGQLVFALGSPAGLESSLTMGIVSAVARQLHEGDRVVYIQTDAPINPGSAAVALPAPGRRRFAIPGTALRKRDLYSRTSRNQPIASAEVLESR